MQKFTNTFIIAGTSRKFVLKPLFLQTYHLPRLRTAVRLFLSLFTGGVKLRSHLGETLIKIHCLG